MHHTTLLCSGVSRGHRKRWDIPVGFLDGTSRRGWSSLCQHSLSHATLTALSGPCVWSLTQRAFRDRLQRHTSAPRRTTHQRTPTKTVDVSEIGSAGGAKGILIWSQFGGELPEQEREYLTLIWMFCDAHLW